MQILKNIWDKKMKMNYVSVAINLQIQNLVNLFFVIKFRIK